MATREYELTCQFCGEVFSNVFIDDETPLAGYADNYPPCLHCGRQDLYPCPADDEEEESQ